MKMIIKLVMLVVFVTSFAIPVMAQEKSQAPVVGGSIPLLTTSPAPPKGWKEGLPEGAPVQPQVKVEKSTEPQRGMWLVNTGSEGLVVKIHINRNGVVEEKEVELGAGREGFLACRHDFISITVETKGLFAKKKHLRQNFEKGSVREVYRTEVKLDGSTLRANMTKV